MCFDTLLARTQPFAWRRALLRPRLGAKRSKLPRLTEEELCQQKQTTSYRTTQLPLGSLINRALKFPPGDVAFWQPGHVRPGSILFGLAPQADGPDQGHGHDQPEPLHPLSMHHFAMMPARTKQYVPVDDPDP